MIVSSAGDIGDCCYLLGILSELPSGPHTLLLEQSQQTKSKDMTALKWLLDAIKDLAEAQPYIKECRLLKKNDKVDWKSANFRVKHYTPGETLLRAHVNNLIDTLKTGHEIYGRNKWLTVAPLAEMNGRVVINRTGRYRNNSFNWKEVVRHYRSRLSFIGLHHEWMEFMGHFGYVEFHPTRNMMDVARAIAGSELFIGNQSCCNAVAEGLKHNLIQESHLTYPDCIFTRANAHHSGDGECILPNVSGSGVLAISAPELQYDYNPSFPPPRGWVHPSIPKPIFHFPTIVRTVSRLGGIPLDQAEKEVVEESVKAYPGFFQTRDHKQLEIFKRQFN